MTRKFFVGGNWKMNGTKFTIDNILNYLNQSEINSNVDIVIAPPSLYLTYVKKNVKPNIHIAAQNCYKVKFFEYLNNSLDRMLFIK